MTYQNIGLTLYLQEIWLKAYEGEILLVDYTDQPDAEFRATTFRVALCNYRKKVRKLKLNPLYKEEWSRIERCKLFVLSRTSFVISKKNDNCFRRYRLMTAKKLPFNCLELPKSITYL